MKKINGLDGSYLVRCLNHFNKKPAKIRKDDKEFAKQLNFKGATCPVYKKTLIANQN